jgi:hypothetical protein
VNLRGAQAILEEARSISRAVQQELDPRGAASVLVSGVLAEQLVRELDADAEPGAVRLGDPSAATPADVLVRVLAGEPTGEDREAVRSADLRGVPVVIVQLWPQADWTPPFILSPFVVECSAGEGFPLREIGDRIVEAAEHALQLAVRVPSLGPSFERQVVRQAVVGSASIAAFRRSEGARPPISLIQVRMLTRLLAVRYDGRAGMSAATPVLGGAVAIALGSGFVFRRAARRARWVLPAPVADATVAGAGTWMLAQATRALAALRSP